MLDNPICPLCQSQNWETLGERVYKPPADSANNTYLATRLSVIFQVWAPTAHEFKITSVVCKKCGFVCYTPRPDEADIAAKYAFLASLEPDVNSQNRAAQARLEALSVRERARSLFQIVHPHLAKRGPLNVLDFGGGRGALLSHFVEAGHQCFLLDYTKECIAGVVRLGSTLDDLPHDSRFDAIICSHVLEHVAEPRLVLTRLADHLHENGIIYLELPIEIWRRPPLPDEPVTHINFFTEMTARNLANVCSLNIRQCRAISYMHASGTRVLATYALLDRTQATKKSELLPGAYQDVQDLLNPGMKRRICHRLIKTGGFRGFVKYLLHRISNPGQAIKK